MQGAYLESFIPPELSPLSSSSPVSSSCVGAPRRLLWISVKENGSRGMKAAPMCPAHLGRTQKHRTQHDGECVASLCGCCGARACWPILGDFGLSPSPFSSQPALPPKIPAINFKSCSFSPPACSWADDLSSRQLSQDILVMLIVGSRSSMIMLMRIASEGTKRKRRNGTKWHKIATSWVHGTSWLPLCTCQGGETQRSELAKLILHFQMERDDSQGLWKKKITCDFFFFFLRLF